jgi:eukaryotic-like serine/threonine-protein kinase
MAALAHDSTPPPLGSSLDRVCPRCRAKAPAGSGWDATCSEHGLAFVETRALAESNQDPLLGTTLAGRFVVLSRIGSGSMGSVYRARQLAVGRDVALKIVRRDRAYDPETKARFEREARAVSRLKSPHSVTAFDFGEAEDGSWFLALEMLEGETLGERLRREKRLHWLEAMRFVGEALRSLAEAHAQGIIHRDLKPDNLFLARVHEPGGERELCKILDFGIAKWVRGEDAPLDQLETLAGTVFGTPRYMSPEQAQGAPLDPRSDLYSLGVLLFQMLSGRAPFIDDDAVVVMAKHIKDSPPELGEAAPNVDIPAPIEAFVRRALEKKPDDRPATAEQMLAELEQAIGAARAVESGVRPHVASPDDLPESLRLAKRRTLVLGGLLLSCVALAIVLAASLWRRPRSVVPTLAPIAMVKRSLENSASIESESANVDARSGVDKESPPPAPSTNSEASAHAAPLVPVKKSGTKSKVIAPLGRRHDERYGRFE